MFHEGTELVVRATSIGYSGRYPRGTRCPLLRRPNLIETPPYRRPPVRADLSGERTGAHLPAGGRIRGQLRRLRQGGRHGKEAATTRRANERDGLGPLVIAGQVAPQVKLTRHADGKSRVFGVRVVSLLFHVETSTLLRSSLSPARLRTLMILPVWTLLGKAALRPSVSMG